MEEENTRGRWIKIKERTVIAFAWFRKRMEEKRIRFSVLFVLGFFLGVFLKAEASSLITIGFQDYLVPRQDLAAYNLNALQEKVLAERGLSLGTPGSGQNICSQ